MMLRQFRNHPSHSALAIGMIAIGLWLAANNTFFRWPPHYEWLENDDIFGLGIIFIGCMFIWWILDDDRSPRSARWNGVLLTIAAGIFAFLTSYEFLIWAATGAYQSWISNAIITSFVVILARRSDTRHE